MLRSIIFDDSPAETLCPLFFCVCSEHGGPRIDESLAITSRLLEKSHLCVSYEISPKTQLSYECWSRPAVGQ